MSKLIPLIIMLLCWNLVNAGDDDVDGAYYKHEQTRDDDYLEQSNNYYSPQSYLLPTIQIVILIHPYNKQQYLPYSLGSIDSQHYPKNRIRVHLLTERLFYDESIDDDEHVRKEPKRSNLSPEDRDAILDERIRLNDQTITMLKQWAKHNRDIYNHIELSIANVRMPPEPMIASDDSYWNREHYRLMIDYKNQALYESFQSWADWLLFMDADVILTNRIMFSNLTQLEGSISDLVVLAPMLRSFGTYSNFWAGMDETGYYLRTEDYLPILERKQVGTFAVPMVHSCVFINLRKSASRLLTFDPIEVQQQLQDQAELNQKQKWSTKQISKSIPYDDIIAFAKSASLNGLNLYVDNTRKWGFIPQPILEEKIFSAEQIKQTILDLRLESLVEGPDFVVSSALDQYVIPNEQFDTLGVDQVYVVNLARRPERKKRMQKCLKMLGIKARFWNATDGKHLTDDYLHKHGIRSLDGYVDPYHKRPITFGEIGCFLSHYRIWEDAYRHNFSKIIILEDDVRFDRNFRSQWFAILERFESLPDEYDFLYLGRKLNDGEYDKETIVDQLFVRPRYSYWTIGYMITRRGIEKLLRANPTSRMLPVDEFLPIMYGSHTNESLVQMYAAQSPHLERLEALSLRHLIVSPTHYVGDPLYISDTEQSDKLSIEAVKNSEPIEDHSSDIFDEENIHKQPQQASIRPPPTDPNAFKHFEL